MIVTFCGHRDITQRSELHEWFYQCVEQLILDGATDFYLGGYGTFDAMAASVVRSFKRQYPFSRSILVLPYLDRKVDATCYDMTTYPPLETVPKRYAILRRNQWMVDAADVVVAYVRYEWGGAAQTLAYAKRKKKRIIQYDMPK